MTGEVPEFTEPHVVEHAPGCVTRAEPSAECDCADLNPETTTDVTVSDAPWWKCRRGHLVQAPEWSYQTRSAVAPRGHRLECPKNNHSAMCDSPLPASESMCGCMHKNMWICSCPPDVTTQDTGPLCNECWEIPSVRDEIAAFVAQLMGTKRQEPEAARAEWSRKVLAPS